MMVVLSITNNKKGDAKNFPYKVTIRIEGQYRSINVTKDIDMNEILIWVAESRLKYKMNIDSAKQDLQNYVDKMLSEDADEVT